MQTSTSIVRFSSHWSSIVTRGEINQSSSCTLATRADLANVRVLCSLVHAATTLAECQGGALPEQRRILHSNQRIIPPKYLVDALQEVKQRLVPKKIGWPLRPSCFEELGDPPVEPYNRNNPSGHQMRPGTIIAYRQH